MSISKRVFGSTSFFVLISLFATVLVSPAFGQAPSSASSFTPLPTVLAQDVTIEETGAASVTGSFTVTNGESRYIGNLTYDYLILGPRPTLTEGELTLDDASEYALVQSGASLALGANEERVVNFNVDTLPTLPVGPYRLRIQLRTLDDRRLGWADANVNLGTDVPAFGTFSKGSVEVESVDPITNEARSTWTPVEGVNVTPGQAVTLTAVAENKGTEQLIGVFELQTQRALTQQATSTTTQGPAVSIEAGDSTTVSMPIKAPTVPGAYSLVGVIQNGAGEAISAQATYRLVVKGVSASIIRATVDQPAAHAEESAIVSFSVVGSADRITRAEGSLSIDVLSDGTVVGTTTSPVSLTAVPTDGTATVVLQQDISGVAGLRVTLKDQAGNVLATSTSTFSDVSFGETVTSPSYMVVAIAIIAVVTIALYMLWKAFRRGRMMPPSNPRTPSATAIALLLLIGGALLGVVMFATTWSPAWAVSLQDSQRDSIGVHYRSVADCRGEQSDCYVEHAMVQTNVTPLRNVAYGSPVVYDVRHTWYACDNAIISDGTVAVKTLQVGGQHVDNLDQASQLAWKTLATRTTSGGSSGFAYIFSGVTTFASPVPNNISTIWTDASTQIRQRSFNLTVDNDDFRWLTFGSANPTVNLQVSASSGAPVEGPITVSPNTSVTLSWTSTNTTSCTASNGWTGSRALSGSENSRPVTTDTTYVLTCSSNQGSASDEVTVNVSSSGTTTPTPDPSTPTPLPDNSADLSIIKQGPSTVMRNAQLSYALKVTNNGPLAATNVKVSDPVPTGLIFNVASSSNACSVAAGKVTCTIPTLASGTSSLLSIVFDVNQTFTCGGSVSNTASVTSNTLDAVPSNNSSQAINTTVQCPECSDATDNDGDGRTDTTDPACHTDNDITKPYEPNKPTETDTQCTDVKDNDADQLVDDEDPGCHVGNDIDKPYMPADDTESGAAPFDPGGFKETE